MTKVFRAPIGPWAQGERSGGELETPTRWRRRAGDEGGFGVWRIRVEELIEIF